MCLNKIYFGTTSPATISIFSCFSIILLYMLSCDFLYIATKREVFLLYGTFTKPIKVSGFFCSVFDFYMFPSGKRSVRW